jgi:hypothetical protein
LVLFRRQKIMGQKETGQKETEKKRPAPAA